MKLGMRDLLSSKSVVARNFVLFYGSQSLNVGADSLYIVFVFVSTFFVGGFPKRLCLKAPLSLSSHAKQTQEDWRTMALFDVDAVRFTSQQATTKISFLVGDSFNGSLSLPSTEIAI